MKANEYIREELIKHLIGLQRVASKQSSLFVKAIKAGSPLIINAIKAGVPSITDNQNITNQRKFNAIAKKIKAIRANSVNSFKSDYEKVMSELIQKEIDYVNLIFQNSTDIVIKTTVPQIAANTMMAVTNIGSRTFDEWFDSVTADETRRIMSIVKQGKNNGETLQQMTRSISRTMNKTRSDADAIARTITNGLTNQARNKFYKANDDIIKKVRFEAILDGRTTEICASKDGRIYDEGAAPIPPLHVRCRSTIMPILDGIEVVGQRITIKDTRTRRLREIDFRKEAKKTGKSVKELRKEWSAAKIGRVPPKTDFQEWMNKQPAEFQEDYFGVKKSKLFRDGNLSIKQMVADDGREFTLDELFNKYPSKFSKANVNP